MDDILIVIAEECLGSRSDDQPLLKHVLSAYRDDGALGREALDVILLLLEERFGDEEGHVYVLVAELLELRVEDLLYVLPDRVAVRSDYHAALDPGVVDELRLLDYIRVPLGEVNVHRGDLFDHFFAVFFFSRHFYRILPFIPPRRRRVSGKTRNGDRNEYLL